MFLWGANFAFVKYLLDTLGVGPFLFIRFVTMPLLAFLLLLLVFKKHVARTWPKREALPRFIACGLIGHALHVGGAGADQRAALHARDPRARRRRAPAREPGRRDAGRHGGHCPIPVGQIRRRPARRLRRPDPARRGVALFALHGAGAPARRTLRAAHRARVHAALRRAADDPHHGSEHVHGGPRPLAAVGWFGLFWAILLSSVGGWQVWAWVNHVRGIASSASSSPG